MSTEVPAMIRVLMLGTIAAAVVNAQPPRMRPPAGYISQVASGGGWKTTITLWNPTLNQFGVTVRFRGGDGAPLVLPLTVINGDFRETTEGSETFRTVEPLAILRIDSEAPVGGRVLQGWAEVISIIRLSGSARFSQRGADGRVFEAVAPLTYDLSRSVAIPYDNMNGQATGVALVNAGSAAAPLEVIVRDASGAWIGSFPFSLRPLGYAAFDIDTQFEVVGGRGLIEFVGPEGAQITGLGLRFTPAGAFTSVPVIHAPQALPLVQ